MAGAYALVIELAREIPLPPRFEGSLAPGRYLYAGSANGPGGIAARVARHLRPRKTRHWHVDWLTGAGAVTAAVALPGGSECAVVTALLGHGAAVPVPGFGASDCRACAAHLLEIPEGLDIEVVLGSLRRSRR